MEFITKTCSCCKQEKRISEFYKFCRSKDGIASLCKICDKSRNEIYRKENPKMIRNNHLMYWYGISLEDYNKLFKEQEGRCAICGMHQSELKRSLSVDHDHETGKIKGLLCNKCNRGIGYFNESVDLLKKASEYILKFN